MYEDHYSHKNDGKFLLLRDNLTFQNHFVKMYTKRELYNKATK